MFRVEKPHLEPRRPRLTGRGAGQGRDQRRLPEGAFQQRHGSAAGWAGRPAWRWGRWKEG